MKHSNVVSSLSLFFLFFLTIVTLLGALYGSRGYDREQMLEVIIAQVFLIVVYLISKVAAWLMAQYEITERKRNLYP